MATSQVRAILACVWLVAMVATSESQAAVDDTPPFYQLKYQGNTAYLLGSIHVGEASFYPLPAKIEVRFNAASALVVEADTKRVDVMALVKKYGVKQMPMDAETQRVLSHYCRSAVNLCASLSQYAPWLQSVQLGMARFARLGYSADYGVDQVLISKNGERPLLELESTEFQFRLLASFDATSQWAMVREVIEVPDAEIHGLVRAWREGDEAQILHLMQGQMSQGDDTQMLDTLLWQRNIDMAAKIRQLMREKSTPQPMFIVVGAGHVVGDKSIVQQMAKYGGQVKNCWLEACE